MIRAFISGFIQGAGLVKPNRNKYFPKIGDPAHIPLAGVSKVVGIEMFDPQNPILILKKIPKPALDNIEIGSIFIYEVVKVKYLFGSIVITKHIKHSFKGKLLWEGVEIETKTPRIYFKMSGHDKRSRWETRLDEMKERRNETRR